jgi:hypothetical protein
MNYITAKFIADICEDIGVDVELYEDYSGRGMYGDTTTGLVSEYSIPYYLLKVIAYLYEEAYGDNEDYEELEIESFKGQDSLGRYKSILY